MEAAGNKVNYVVNLGERHYIACKAFQVSRDDKALKVYIIDRWESYDIKAGEHVRIRTNAGNVVLDVGIK